MASAALGIEEKLWLMADKLRGSMDSSEYKNVVLGLLFLKYISDAFEEKHQELLQDEYADEEVCFARPFYTILQRKSTHLCA